MLTLVLVLAAVSIATEAKEVDPNTFRCTATSPTTTDPAFSSTKPYVGLTHIFCGQIKADGSAAEGFHDRPGGIDPTDGNRRVAFAEDLKVDGYEDGIDGFAKISVWNSKTNKYMERTTPSGSDYFYFFPTKWGIPQTTEKIQELYAFCYNLRKKEYGDYCIKKYRNEGAVFDVVIYVNLKVQSTIISSFPAPAGYCDRQQKIKLVCDYGKS